MDEQQLLAAIHSLASPDTRELACGESGHRAGHICLVAPGGADLPTLLDELGNWHGEPRTLVTGGHVAPAVTERTGLPLLAPWGDGLVEMRAWAFGGRWIGCGSVRTGDGVRPVVLIAERAAPSLEELSEDASWVDRVVAVTGWEADRRHPIDWAAAEARLGTALPRDYKRLAELFGRGAFDGYLDVHLPDGSRSDLVRHAERLAEWAAAHGNGLWEPHRLYPAPGGLLQWASSEQADGFYWLTEGPDPDKWPILASEDDCTTYRFAGSTAEFVYRLLTDPQQPFSTARYFSAHWFQSYGSPEPADD
ncbi:SMI1/KNR4 family protein [Streptomyces sp. NPDC101227]|uniref:SMI1/KNR4 family protein n=1 Tax=Streptomyces sp. NPDC101227 TaxID=3366136 RepID=UPI003815D724